MININVAGTPYPVPSGPQDSNWSAKLVAFLQALAAAVTSSALAVSRLSTQTSAVGIGNGADNTEDTLMSYSVPANTLPNANQTLRITAYGFGVNTADATTLRMYFGAQLLITKVLPTTSNNKWKLVAEVARIGPTSQIASAVCVSGATGAGGVAQDCTSPAETLSGPVVVKVTGQRGGTPTANSITQNLMMVELVP
jgi:hypothetical protein